MKGVLAAVELGPATAAILESARTMAAGLGWPLRVLHVVPDEYLMKAAHRADQYATNDRAVLEQTSKLLGRLAQEELVRLAPEADRLALHGNPGLAVAGESLKSGITVLAAEGGSQLERVARGGVSRYLLYRGERIVLSLDSKRPLSEITRLGVALDAGSTSASALTAARYLAEHTGADLVGLHLVSVLPGSCCVPNYLPPELLKVPDLLEAAEHALRERFPEIERLIVSRGEEIEGLLGLAAQEQLDLLVIGSKAKSSFRTRLGACLEGMLFKSELPLLIVPEAVHLD